MTRLPLRLTDLVQHRRVVFAKRFEKKHQNERSELLVGCHRDSCRLDTLAWDGQSS